MQIFTGEMVGGMGGLGILGGLGMLGIMGGMGILGVVGIIGEKWSPYSTNDERLKTFS